MSKIGKEIILGMLLVCFFSLSVVVAGEWKVGASWRGNMKIKIKESGSPYEGLGILSFPSEDDGGFADREFDDGYVKLDGGTLSADGLGQGLTWNWGYDSGSQYDSQNQILTFHRQAQISSSNNEVSWNPLSHSKHLESNGIALEYDDVWWTSSDGRWQMFYEAGIDGSHIDCTTKCRRDGRITGGNFEVIDEYNYDVSGVSMPSPGYAGSYLGPFDSPAVVPSPLIPEKPDSIQRRILDGNGENIVSRTVKNYLKYDITGEMAVWSLGSGLKYCCSEKITIGGCLNLLLSMVNLEVKCTDDINGRSKKDTLRIIPGFGVDLRGDYAISKNCGFYLWGGYQYFSSEAKVNINNAEITFSPNGYVVKCGIEYHW